MVRQEALHLLRPSQRGRSYAVEILPRLGGNTPRAEIRLGEDARRGEPRFRHGRSTLGLEALGRRFAVDGRDIGLFDPPFQTEPAYWRTECSGLPRLHSSLGLNDGDYADPDKQ